MVDKSEKQAPEELNYEQAFAELEQIVNALEEGDLSLEQAMLRFERGQALAERCAQLLDEAELKLTRLVADEGGGYVETDYEQEDD